MRYGSVCSGIEAASVAWHPLGWRPAFFSEIEAFPRAVLAHHFPDVPCHGDFTTIRGDEYGAIDLLVGGTPCQSFSIAGLRGGLADDRGNLALEFLRLADRARPRWVVWENVHGVLSSNGGRDFGSILGGLVELGYGFAYRVLDAQFFGVPQRRRRVFVVGYLGDWRPPAAVLLERHSLSAHSAPRRKTGQAVAALTANGVGTCGADDDQGQAGHIVPVAYRTTGTDPNSHVVAFQPGNLARGAGSAPSAAVFPTLKADHGRGISDQHPHVLADFAVRRLTPVECERLQGFPCNWTRIPWRGKPAEQCPDGPRYKAIGNSMAVPCMRWIGERIQAVENIVRAA